MSHRKLIFATTNASARRIPTDTVVGVMQLTLLEIGNGRQYRQVAPHGHRNGLSLNEFRDWISGGRPRGPDLKGGCLPVMGPGSTAMMDAVKVSPAGGLDVRRVMRADWGWIAAWFGDEELDRRLGPLDEEWLDHVLSVSDGVQLVITAADGAPVGLVGCAWDPAGGAHAITDLAVCPWRRRSGLGRRVLASVLTWEGHPPTQQWIAFVDPDNRPAFDFFTSAGWHLDGLDEGMHRFSQKL